jgi:predicted aldo/keto reductase-like oxidoreductase
MLSQGFPFDSCQMPLNVLDAHYESFEKEIVPICQQQGIAIIGMKSLGGGHLMESGIDVTPAEAIRYSMSLPIATLVSGMNSLEVMRQNLETARNFTPLTDEERQDILARSAPGAPNGAYEFYKTSRRFDAAEGRKAHNYPLTAAD